MWPKALDTSSANRHRQSVNGMPADHPSVLLAVRAGLRSVQLPNRVGVADLCVESSG